ncbi:MAG TPA: MarR family transcriptional regulator [Ignavibacteriaceae bacterium]|nr:MarR family transcriptional regulator [Ignavibacteriaceae bacterium]
MKTTKKYGEQIDLALSMWVKLVRAHSVFAKKSLDDIRRYGLTEPQFGALECLGHLGPMTIGNLCSKQLVSGGNMTLVVDNLEKEGLVERVHSKEDRRTIIVQLTSKGEQRFNEIFLQHAEIIKDLTSVLTNDEQVQLSGLLKKLGFALKDK